MISTIKEHIRKHIRRVENDRPYRRINASMLEGICKAANPPLLSYLKFLKENFSHMNSSIPILYYENLYKQTPFRACKEIKNVIQQYGDEEILKLFNITFCQCFQNATRLIKKYRLKDNVILVENDNILIRNLDITGNMFLEFNQFLEVSFIRNIFRGDTDIKITNSIEAEGIFKRNQARENLNIIFYNTSRITSTLNKYMANVIFNYQPCAFGLKDNLASRCLTTINFICNEIFSLSIVDYIKEENFDKNSMPIKHIGFTQGNKIEQLRIQTVSNKTFNKSLKAPSADIESIFFDTRENIGSIRDEGTPLFAFTEAFFRELKKQAIEKEDRLLETTYHRQEKIFLRTRLFRLEDKLISWWGEFASDTGTSWKRSLGWLFLLQFILTLTTYFLFAGCTSYLDKGLIPFLGLFAWFMNPVSLLPPVEITMALGGIYIIFLFQKIFSALFYYEIVKVLRRFSK